MPKALDVTRCVRVRILVPLVPSSFMSMSEDICMIINQASGSVEFNIIIFLKIIICFGGAAFLVRQWKVHGVRFLGHKNSRILFHAYYSTFVILGFTAGPLYLIDFVRLRFTCVSLDFRLVILLRSIIVSALLSAHIMLILLSMERLYSSLFPARFERSSSQCLTTALVITVVACATSFAILLLTDRFRLFTAHYVPHTNARVPENAEQFVMSQTALAITNGIALLIFTLDVYLNFYRKIPKNLSLGASYQFSENRRVMLVLMPIEIADSIISLVSSIAQILYANYAANPSLLSRQIFLEYTTLTHSFPIVLAIIIEWKVGRRKREIRPLEPRIDHFENLQRFWE